MTPDVYVNLQFVNATSQPITQGLAGPGFFNQYQMAQWFSFPNAPSPICAKASTETYFVQFLRGVGDEDDAADLQLNIGDATVRANAVMWLQARSDSNSGHYMQVQFQNPTASLYIYGVGLSSDWDSAGASGINWGVPFNNQVSLGYAPSRPQCIAIVDLTQIFDPATAAQYFIAVRLGNLTQDQQNTLYKSVSAFIMAGGAEAIPQVSQSTADAPAMV